ncbi:MAG TPA: hypothetical protein VJ985_08015 [Gammaproteobacteria bacterium]|nr:hypothetical protein [Gammaproteobacteria bacterium]
MSEQRNQELIGPASAASRRWDRLLTDPAQGTREADDILGQVRGERLSWDW